jgi:hypothetical protein
VASGSTDRAVGACLAPKCGPISLERVSICETLSPGSFRSKATQTIRERNVNSECGCGEVYSTKRSSRQRPRRDGPIPQFQDYRTGVANRIDGLTHHVKFELSMMVPGNGLTHAQLAVDSRALRQKQTGGGRICQRIRTERPSPEDRVSTEMSDALHPKQTAGGSEG